MINRKIATIARFTVLEAVRTRLPWLFAVVVGLILLAAYFLYQLAVTDAARLLIAFSAAATRLAAVFVMCLYILNSMVREFNDKGLELVLALDLPRAHYVAGRLLGYSVIAALLAMIAMLPQLVLAPASAALAWGLSLALELMVMTALSVFCIVTFTQLMPAASFVLGFYVLARALNAMRIMSEAPLAGGDTLSHQVISQLVDLLALIVPALDRYAQTAWLTETSAVWSQLPLSAAQAGVYITLLGVAAAFDLHRRNL